MGKPQASFDAEIFARTASLCVTKSNGLAQSAVESLANDIVRRLSRTKSRDVIFERPDISGDSVDAFCGALTQPGP